MWKGNDVRTCHECGAVVSDEAEYCEACGASLPSGARGDLHESQHDQQQGQTPSDPPQNWDWDDGGSRKADHTKAVLSLVLGIVGMVVYVPLAFLLDLLPVTGAFVLIASAVVGIALGVAGLILAIMAKKAGNREGIRTAGFVLSLLSIIINAGWFAFGACVVSFVYSNGTPSGGFWS